MTEEQEAEIGRLRGVIAETTEALAHALDRWKHHVEQSETADMAYEMKHINKYRIMVSLNEIEVKNP